MRVSLKALFVVATALTCQTAVSQTAVSQTACVHSLADGGCQSAITQASFDHGVVATAVDTAPKCVHSFNYAGCQTSATEQYFAGVPASAPAAKVAAAPAPVAQPVVVAHKTKTTGTCDKAVDEKSLAAVGLPCETTAEFIDTLNLSKKRKAKALSLVNSVDTHSAQAHH